jgi:hypothetical protein
MAWSEPGGGEYQFEGEIPLAERDRSPGTVAPVGAEAIRSSRHNHPRE